MARKIDKLYPRHRANMYDAMYDALAEQVQLPVEVCKRLGIGWAPIVPFSKRLNFHGWWSIPERNIDGEVTGLHLRSRKDHKTSYPGSKHGLVYVPNPDHTAGRLQVSYDAGWVRPMDAGVDCPICGKPDGCLLSAENPDDPRDVICIRVKEGAIRPQRMGHLHWRYDRDRSTSRTAAFAATDKPVIVVEGWTDAAAALAMGLPAVGRPGALAGIGMLVDLLRGCQSIIVVGENDDVNPATGKRPGHEGMTATFQALRRVVPDTTMVLPPSHIKDLRRWYISDGLTGDDLIEYAKTEGHSPDEETILPDSKPLTFAKTWLHAHHRMAGRNILRYYQGRWFRWNGVKYDEVDAEMDVRGPLYEWADNKFVTERSNNGGETITPFVCHKGTINNIMDALLHPCPVRSKQVPTWINDGDGPDPDDIIVFDNGLLWVSAYLRGADPSEYLLPHSPDFFTTFALPFSFDPSAKCPTWKAYLTTTLGDEADKIRLLREWFGYCLTPDMSREKFMLFRGPKRSGKGTALTMLQYLVGAEQSASINFSQLMESHGLDVLVGKLVAIMGDARLPRRGDNARALETMLNIIGRDPITINPKYQKQFTEHLKCRFTLATNLLPELPDHAGAMEARLNILQFPHSFLGKEDWGLKDKLRAEAPGVCIWALEGLRRLREQGRFTLPDSSRVAMREWRTSTSPTAAFLEECCNEDDPEAEVGKQELFDAWDRWSSERGMKQISKARFYERFKLNAPTAHSVTYEKGQRKFSVMRGVTLKTWAQKQYLGRPT